MVGIIIVNPDHTVESWTSSSGQTVLHTGFTTAQGKRRITHACAPVMGPVPVDQEPWNGVELPQNGVLQLQSQHDWHSTRQTGGVEETYTFLANFNGTATYPWQYAVRLCYVFNKKLDVLTIQLYVYRSVECRESRLMPLSCGFHPYLALQEGRAVLWHDGKSTVIDKSLRTARFLKETKFSEPTTLITGKSLFTVSGNHDLLVTTDDSKYVCIQPVNGLKKPILLKRGQHHILTTSIIFEDL